MAVSPHPPAAACGPLRRLAQLNLCLQLMMVNERLRTSPPEAWLLPPFAVTANSGMPCPAARRGQGETLVPPFTCDSVSLSGVHSRRLLAFLAHRSSAHSPAASSSPRPLDLDLSSPVAHALCPSLSWYCISQTPRRDKKRGDSRSSNKQPNFRIREGNLDNLGAYLLS
jgi:hypothetical protein